MPFKSYREESKTNWGNNLAEGQSVTREDLKFGCLLRIADATEKMALRYSELIDRAERYERWYEEARARAAKLYRSNAALRGHIKRLKKLSKEI